MGFYQFSGTINFMTTPFWLRPKTSGNADLNTNILIIGAGHAGLSTAYWLTEMSPDLKITILERSFCGAGASGRNAGFLTLGSASFYKSLFLKWGKQRTSDIYNFTNFIRIVSDEDRSFEYFCNRLTAYPAHVEVCANFMS